LAPQVVADLDSFLVLVRRLVFLVVALRLEEEVTDLPDAHCERPSEQRRCHRVAEQQCVGHQETARANQVQRLVDTTVVIVTMVIPTLFFELSEERGHGPSLKCDRITRVRQRTHRRVSLLSRFARPAINENDTLSCSPASPLASWRAHECPD